MSEKNISQKLDVDEKISRSEKLHLLRAIFEITEDEKQTEILLFLLAHGEISLTRLSQGMRKSKATILRYIRPMMDKGIVQEVKKEKSREKYYAMNESIHEKNSSELFVPFFHSMEIADLTPLEQEAFHKSVMSMGRSAFLLLKQVLDITLRYMELFNDSKKNIPVQDEMTLGQWFDEMGLSILIRHFNEETYSIYQKHYSQFRANLENEIRSLKGTKTDTNDSDTDGVDYLSWSIVLPIKKILKWS